MLKLLSCTESLDKKEAIPESYRSDVEKIRKMLKEE